VRLARFRHNQRAADKRTACTWLTLGARQEHAVKPLVLCALELVMVTVGWSSCTHRHDHTPQTLPHSHAHSHTLTMSHFSFSRPALSHRSKWRARLVWRRQVQLTARAGQAVQATTESITNFSEFLFHGLVSRRRRAADNRRASAVRSPSSPTNQTPQYPRHVRSTRRDVMAAPTCVCVCVCVCVRVRSHSLPLARC
jgi:hypothetical protein